MHAPARTLAATGLLHHELCHNTVGRHARRESVRVLGDSPGAKHDGAHRLDVQLLRRDRLDRRHRAKRLRADDSRLDGGWGLGIVRVGASYRGDELLLVKLGHGRATRSRSWVCASRGAGVGTGGRVTLAQRTSHTRARVSEPHDTKR